MRWTNKIMTSNQDQSNSRLSSRSLSKFKKVNLQKSEVQISSNDQLEKSQLKLTSVQKIKLSNFNRSYISNYIGHAGPISNPSPSPMSTNVQKSDYRFSNINEQRNKNIIISKSQRIFYPQIDNEKKMNHIESLQGYALFRKETQKSLTASQKQKQSPTHEQNLTSQQMLKNILQKLRSLFVEFKEVSQTIKGQLKQSIKMSFEKMQNSLITYVKQFESNLEIGIQQLINLTKRQINPSSFQFQNILKNPQTFPPSPDNNSFYKIKYFDHQRIPSKEIEVQYGKSRPNSFKDKFKQIIDDSDHKLASQNQMEKQQIKKALESKEKSASKLFRKRTNPTPRVNTLLDNDSSFLNESSLNQEHNTSTNSIKYCKIKERSASKSVKKLHEKIILIKSIFKSQTTQSEANNNKNPIQNR